MIAIHPVHRRLAEIYLKAQKLGSYDRLSSKEQMDLYHCLRVNADLVRKLDELKNMAFIAHQAGDMEWEQDICQQIDELEANMI
ncbi:Uncharacterised protein [Mycobacterium tuberculosis]|nr:Uncharacterised protein [Mycobacterium tuberculosis]